MHLMIPCSPVNTPNCRFHISNLGFFLKDFCISLIQSVSATAISWLVSSFCVSTFFCNLNFKIYTNWRTRAVTLKSRCKLLYSSHVTTLAIPMVWATTSNEEEVSDFHFSLSPAFISLNYSCRSCPMLNSSLPDSAISLRYVGPSIHSAHSDSSDGLIPLEGISAGLFFPRQCLQLFTGTSVLISFCIHPVLDEWFPFSFFTLDPS